jgi:hypothetical protein
VGTYKTQRQRGGTGLGLPRGSGSGSRPRRGWLAQLMPRINQAHRVIRIAPDVKAERAAPVFEIIEFGLDPPPRCLRARITAVVATCIVHPTPAPPAPLTTEEG